MRLFSIYWILCVLHLASAQASGLYPFEGTGHELPQGELSPLSPAFQRAEIVAISESDHDSSAYIQMQLRLLRFGIEKYGVRVVFLEASAFQAEAAHRYVEGRASCSGAGLRDALKSLAPYWNTEAPISQDRADFLRWICERNAENPRDKVAVHGMDLWDAPWRIFELTQKYFSKIPWDHGLDAALAQVQGQCWAITATSWSQFIKTEEFKSWEKDRKIARDRYEACDLAVRQIPAYLDLYKRRLIRALGGYRWTLVRNAAENLTASQDTWDKLLTDITASVNARDQAMAANLQRFVEIEGRRKKAVLISHNVHATKQRRPTDWGGWGKSLRPLGWHLHERLGRKYQVIGQTGYDVGRMNVKRLKPTSPASIDLELSRRPSPGYLIDVRGEFARSRARWFVQNENSASFPNGVYLRLPDHFDFLVFHRVSAGSIPWPRSRPTR